MLPSVCALQKRVDGVPKVKQEDSAQPAPMRQAADTAAPSSAPVQKGTDGLPDKAAAPAVQSAGERDGKEHARGQERADQAKDHVEDPAATDAADGSRPQSDTGAPVLANGNAPADGAGPAVRLSSPVNRLLLSLSSAPVSILCTCRSRIDPASY